MFSRAIVRTPGRSLVEGLSNAGLGRPDHALALVQHQGYIEALRRCGLEVLVLEPDEAHPDSTFVEDAALVTPYGAVITRPAAPSRAGETAAIRPALERFFERIATIEAPGTLDGGDVMQVGDHCYIGLSGRTNRAGAEQLAAILAGFGMTASTVPVTQVLHLKTGVTCVADRTLLALDAFAAYPGFAGFTVLPVPAAEAGAANCINLNGTVLMPAGAPLTRARLDALGVPVIALDISEYARLDGGLTCLSLRF